MDKPTKIETLLAQSKSGPPSGFRAQMLSTIRESSRQQTRRDDLRTVATGVAVILFVALMLFSSLAIQHSSIIETILSAN